MSSVCPDWIVGCNLFSTPSMQFNLLTTRHTDAQGGDPQTSVCAPTKHGFCYTFN